MSSPGSTTTNTASEEQKETPTTVLLIAHKQNQFAAAASFLTRRGVPCTIKGNIKESIQFIQKNKPTFIFLSWNLPNANIVKTYQLFTKTFHVECIVFAERPDGKTAAELANSKLPEIMQAPVSGPGLYMRIQKLIKAKEDGSHEKNHEIRTARESGAHKEDDKIVLKSSNKNQNDNFITFSGNKKDTDKPGIINFQHAKYSEEDIEISANNDDPNANDISAYLDQIPDEELSATLEANDISQYEIPNSSENNNIDEFTATENEQNDELLSVEENSMLQPSARKRKKKEQNFGTVVNIAKKTKNGDASDLLQYDVSKREQAAILNHKNPNLTQQNRATEDKPEPKEALLIDFQPKIQSKSSESILLKKTKIALEKSTRPVYDSYEKVTNVSKAKILNIHTARFHGYLIFVVPMFHEFNRGVFLQIKQNLQSDLKKDGEDLLHFEELNVDLEQLDFLNWCQLHAEFFIQTGDQRCEIICAYFPIEPSLPKVEEASKMASINIQDLKPETKTNFDLFIHLPKNNKFLRYLGSGDLLTTRHTQKFEKHRLKNLHIKKEEISSFKEYFASQQILDTTRKKKAA